MVRKNLYVFMLYLAGCILLGHNLVPHHHHRSTEKQYSGLHSKNSSHKHHGHGHRHELPVKEKSNPNQPIEHHISLETGDKFLIKQSSKTDYSLYYHLPQALSFHTLLISSLVENYYPVYQVILKLPSHKYNFSLRGPPKLAIS